MRGSWTLVGQSIRSRTVRVPRSGRRVDSGGSRRATFLPIVGSRAMTEKPGDWGAAGRRGPAMSDNNQHPYLGKLHEQLESRKIDRREFLRTATLLRLSATAAYAAAGRILRRDAGVHARAQPTTKPQGGVLRVVTACLE